MNVASAAAFFPSRTLPAYSTSKAAVLMLSECLRAELAGTTRSKVDELMNTFRKRGFIERHTERNGGVQVHRSMLSVVLQE